MTCFRFSEASQKKNRTFQSLNVPLTISLKCCNHNIFIKCTLDLSFGNYITKQRVVKGIFVTRDRPFFFPVKCEMANFFLVNRDFHSSREAWFSKIIFRETRNKCLIRREPWFSLCLCYFRQPLLRNKWHCVTMTGRLVAGCDNVVGLVFGDLWPSIIFTLCVAYFDHNGGRASMRVSETRGGGYSHTLPIRVCAAQRGHDFEAPDLERSIHFGGVF